MADTDPFRIAVLISGGGTTLLNLAKRAQAGELPVSIELVISSSAKAKGLGHAATFEISSEAITQQDCGTREAFSDRIFDRCREAKIDLVVMGGFLKHVLIPDDFENRVTNIHPSLIPSFCGQGCYGNRVHESVLEYGAKVSGCTVHFVDNEYDNGPIIMQRAVPVIENDTAHTLAARVFEQECEIYPAAIRKIATGKVSVDGRRVIVRD